MKSQVKDQAKTLTQRAKELGVELKHTQALELLASLEGKRNRNVKRKLNKLELYMKEEEEYYSYVKRYKELTGEAYTNFPKKFNLTDFMPNISSFRKKYKIDDSDIIYAINHLKDEYNFLSKGFNCNKYSENLKFMSLSSFTESLELLPGYARDEANLFIKNLEIKYYDEGVNSFIEEIYSLTKEVAGWLITFQCTRSQTTFTKYIAAEFAKTKSIIPKRNIETVFKKDIGKDINSIIEWMFREFCLGIYRHIDDSIIEDAIEDFPSETIEKSCMRMFDHYIKMILDDYNISARKSEVKFKFKEKFSEEIRLLREKMFLSPKFKEISGYSEDHILKILEVENKKFNSAIKTYKTKKEILNEQEGIFSGYQYQL